MEKWWPVLHTLWSSYIGWAWLMSQVWVMCCVLTWPPVPQVFPHQPIPSRATSSPSIWWSQSLTTALTYTLNMRPERTPPAQPPDWQWKVPQSCLQHDKPALHCPRIASGGAANLAPPRSQPRSLGTAFNLGCHRSSWCPDKSGTRAPAPPMQAADLAWPPWWPCPYPCADVHDVSCLERYSTNVLLARLTKARC